MTALRFAELMATPMGRAARALLGLVIIALGFFVGGAGGAALIAVGLVPIAAGVFNVCLIAPLLGVPFRGANLAAR